MKPQSTRTIAALAAVLAVVVAIVLWLSKPAEVQVIEFASAKAGASPAETPALSRGVSSGVEDHAGDAPAGLHPAVLEKEAPEEVRSSPAKPRRVDLIVVVTDPTNSLDDDRERSAGWIVPERGHSTSRGGPRGRYSFSVEPGRVLFLLHQSGFKPVERWFELMPDEPVHREEIVLEPTWRLTINLRMQDGSGLCTKLYEIQDPLFRRKGSHPLTITASVDPPGQATDVEHLKRNEWLVQVPTDEQRIDIVDDPPVYVTVFLGDRILATRRLDTRIPEITFRIEPDALQTLMSHLVLQLADAYTAGPVEGVQATLVNFSGEQARVTSDAEGRVPFRPQTPGKYRLDLDWENKFLTSREVDLLSGETTDLGTIALTTGVEISGRFSDVDEKPDRVWDTWFYAEDADDGPASRHLFPVSSSGRFSTWGFAAGRYVLGAISHERLGDDRWGVLYGVSGPVAIDTRSGPVRDLVIEMHTISYLRLRPRIADFAEYVCTLRTKDGRFCGSGRLRDRLGDWTIAPGSYFLSVTRLNEIVARVPFEIGAGTVTLDLP